jgi:hypothetical protein
VAFFVDRGKMKKGTKGNRYLSWTANALLLLVLVHPIFHECKDLAHSEFFSSINHIESLHPEDLSITRDEHHYTGEMVISTLPGTIPEKAGIFNHSTNYPQTSILPNKTLVLRC